MPIVARWSMIAVWVMGVALLVCCAIFWFLQGLKHMFQWGADDESFGLVVCLAEFWFCFICCTLLWYYPLWSTAIYTIGR